MYLADLRLVEPLPRCAFMAGISAEVFVELKLLVSVDKLIIIHPGPVQT